MSQALPIKTRRSVAEWKQLMAEYEAGTVSQRAFCERHQLAYGTFCYWRKRLSSSAVSEKSAESLVELPVLAAYAPTDWRVELDLGQGVVLRLK